MNNSAGEIDSVGVERVRCGGKGETPGTSTSSKVGFTQGSAEVRTAGRLSLC